MQFVELDGAKLALACPYYMRPEPILRGFPPPQTAPNPPPYSAPYENFRFINGRRVSLEEYHKVMKERESHKSKNKK